jgi:multiple sugar transport system permease protein
MTTNLSDHTHNSRVAGSRRRTRGRLGNRWTPYLFMAPAALYLVILQGIPLVQEFRLSFSRTSLLNPNDNVWVGFGNFEKIFTSPDFQRTLMTTFIYVVACVVGAVGVGLATALLLNGNFRGRGVARALITVPWAAPAVAVSLIATWMFNAQYGIVNRVLDVIGLGVPGGAILDSQTLALPAILVTTIWELFPFASVVLVSALQSVPEETVEAAKLDGAGGWWIFRVATWPVIKPTVGLLTLLMTVWSIRRFELIWLMTKGGPVGATKTLVIDLYSRAFESNNLGTAAAVGMVGVIISLMVVTASLIVNRRSEQENSR